MALSSTETASALDLVRKALDEDLAGFGDLTSEAIIPADRTGKAAFVARSDGVLAGLPLVGLVALGVDRDLKLEYVKEDGAAVQAGERFAFFSGSLRALLAAERTALNFLQHLSGIATLTRRYVDAVAGLPCRILDTRKTTPRWRLLEKYAVRQGGGHNHRMGLWDGVLIKDNHLAALGGGPQAIRRAVEAARAHVGPDQTLEVEVDTLEQLDAALACRPSIVLLDNMAPEQMCEAVRCRNANAPAVLLEASGGVNLATVRAIAETGVDRISVGALTHSAPALDIALDYQTS